MLPSRLLNENITNETYYTTNETYFPTVTPTAGVYIANADSTMNKESYFPSMAPTPVDYVSSNDSSIIKETFRVYGSLYLFFFLMFCYVRPKFPKYYNIRSWVPELKCDLAVNQTYGVISWCWQVLSVPDDDLLKSCGMDALCFIRCLRFGAKLSLLGSVMASWLIPLYWTAEESEETKHLTDKFVLMSIASLPIKSPRFVGPVVAMYFIILYSMHLITKELKWFCCMRHKFLSQRVPRNYACYVSGIPSEYRSSYKLADYFQQNSGKASVLEAHVAMDIPLLEAKVARREKVVKKLEHAIALERKKGVTLTHVSLKLQDGINAIKKENTVDALRKELDSLNRKIPRSVGEILQDHDRFKSNLKKTKTRGSIALQLAVIDDDKSTHSDSNDQGKERLSIEWDGDSNYDSSTSGLGGPQGSMEESAFKSDDSNDSQLQESGTHPFLSMLGLDSFVFHQNNGTLEQFLMGNSDTGEAINQAQVSDVENGCMLEESNASVKSTTPQEKVPGEFIVERSQGGSASTKVTSTQSISGGDIEQPKGPKQNIVNNHQSSSQRRSKQSSMMLPIQSTMALHARKVGSISMQGAKKVGSRTKVVGSAVKKAIQDVNTEAVAANLKKVGTIGVQGVKTAGSMGVARMIKAADLGIQNAAAVVPLRIKKEEGKPREAGFVVFSDLYTTHAARQMLQHPSGNLIACDLHLFHL